MTIARAMVKLGTLRFRQSMMGISPDPFLARTGFGEPAVVEDQQELTSVRSQPLNRVRYSRGEEPQVVFAHIANEGSS
jgi:hypothetical protein